MWISVKTFLTWIYIPKTKEKDKYACLLVIYANANYKLELSVNRYFSWARARAILPDSLKSKFYLNFKRDWGWEFQHFWQWWSCCSWFRYFLLLKCVKFTCPSFLAFETWLKMNILKKYFFPNHHHNAHISCKSGNWYFWNHTRFLACEYWFGFTFPLSIHCPIWYIFCRRIVLDRVIQVGFDLSNGMMVSILCHFYQALFSIQRPNGQTSANDVQLFLNHSPANHACWANWTLDFALTNIWFFVSHNFSSPLYCYLLWESCNCEGVPHLLSSTLHFYYFPSSHPKQTSGGSWSWSKWTVMIYSGF